MDKVLESGLLALCVCSELLLAGDVAGIDTVTLGVVTVVIGVGIFSLNYK